MQNYNFCSIKDIPQSTSGIYSIVNILNNHRYIGSSKNIRARLYQHYNKLNKNKHHSIHLQNAFNKYGQDKFIIQILEQCEPIRDTLIFIEQKYLDLNPEYNIAKLASCPAQLNQSYETRYKRALKLRGKKRTEEFKKRLSRITMNKPGKKVDQFDLDGVYIRTFDSTAQASRHCGDHKTRGVAIQCCCNGKGKQAHGFQWRWHTEYTDNIGKYISHSMDVIEKSKKIIYKLDMNDKLLQVYNSISDAARDLNSKNLTAACSNIVQCAKGNTISAYGFKWRYNYDK